MISRWPAKASTCFPFDEDAGDADRDCGAVQLGHETALALRGRSHHSSLVGTIVAIIIAKMHWNGQNNFMSRPTSAALPRVARLLAELGENIRLARRRRGLSAVLMAERAGMSRPTLRAIERGDAGVTLGAVANVLHSLGLEQDLAQLARADERGRELQDAALAPRRSTRQKPGRADGG